jgi:hypothetical protein
MIKFSSSFLCFLIGVTFLQTVSAQDSDNKKIKETISIFFKGLQNGDTLTLKKSISNDLLLHTTFINNEEVPILRKEEYSSFLKVISLKKEEDIWEERLLSYHIQIDGPMANVWTPYEFFLNNTFSHCGVNSFQLFNDGEQWKIVSVMDTRRKTACSN